MKLKYVISAALFILLGFILVILPDRSESDDLEPEMLLQEIIDPGRFLTTDMIAERLVNDDPSLFLVDVRSIYDYEEFTLPGAFNIPLEEILLDEWQGYLSQYGKDVVFFSNGSIRADKAWILSRREGHKEIFVMKGGLNEWFRTVMNPVPPPQTAPKEAFELYSFRRGAAQYFTGGNTIEPPEVEAEKVTISRKKKKTVVEGGC